MSNVTKVLRCTMPDGSKWDIKAAIIAQDRAVYYSKKRPEEGDLEFFYNESFNDDFQLIDWAENNMNWSDVEPFAFLVEKSKDDYDESWCNAEKEITYNKVNF